MFLLLANPNDVATLADVTYLMFGRPPITKAYTLPARSRLTAWVDYEDPSLASAEVSVMVRTRDGAGIIAERAMWWPTGPGHWFEAHNSPGTTTSGERWGLAEGEVGGPRSTQTWILIANTSSYGGSALVTLIFEDGTTAEKTVPLAASSRTAIGVGVDPDFAPYLGNVTQVPKRFGAIVESLGGTPAQIVVERAMSSNADGVAWAASLRRRGHEAAVSPATAVPVLSCR